MLDNNGQLTQEEVQKFIEIVEDFHVSVKPSLSGGDEPPSQDNDGEDKPEKPNYWLIIPVIAVLLVAVLYIFNNGFRSTEFDVVGMRQVELPNVETRQQLTRPQPEVGVTEIGEALFIERVVPVKELEVPSVDQDYLVQVEELKAAKLDRDLQTRRDASQFNREAQAQLEEQPVTNQTLISTEVMDPAITETIDPGFPIEQLQMMELPPAKPTYEFTLAFYPRETWRKVLCGFDETCTYGYHGSVVLPIVVDLSRSRLVGSAKDNKVELHLPSIYKEKAKVETDGRDDREDEFREFGYTLACQDASTVRELMLSAETAVVDQFPDAQVLWYDAGISSVSFPSGVLTYEEVAARMCS